MRLFLLLSLLVAPVAAHAQIRPVPGAGDPRIQTVVYDAAQVVSLQVASGYQLTVELGAGERIENVAIGDSSAWQVTPNKRGDHLFIKPLQNGVSTNMTVVTDARSYNFELLPLFGPLPDMAFTVRFTYPAPAVATVANTPAAQPGRYKLSGARDIWPATIDDDGEKTFITWPADRALPAVFAIDSRRNETLLDGAMRDGEYVIDSVQQTLVFRFDKKIARAVRIKAKKK